MYFSISFFVIGTLLHVPWKSFTPYPHMVFNFCVLMCRWQVLRRDCHAMVITFESSGNHWLLFIFDTEMNMQARDLSWYRAWPAYCMVDCMSHSRIFHLYGDVTIAMLEEAAKLGLCSALMPTAHDVRAWVFPLSLIRRTTPFCCIILTTNKGMWRIYSNLDPPG